MSSVTRFLRQIPAENQYVGGPIELATLAPLAYEFVNTTANYTGNYPPGAMVLGSTDTSTYINFQILNARQFNPNAMYTLRDMGKTIYAGIAVSVSDAQNLLNITNHGYFRQYQLLVFPGSSTVPNTFGVGGSNSGGYTPYLTFYLPSIVAGRFPTITSSTQLPTTAGGAM